ncbi:MAG TPA: response regulator transcription factor [Blastocatellia bacterium]|jgi:DNA-binding NarL/FixJ family response regulator
MATKLRIMLAEDHAVVREGLKALVAAQADMNVIGDVSNGQDAVAQAKELNPDVVVIDISMPKMNGFEATERIKRACPRTKVLALTRHMDTGFIQQLFRAGASGYVLKQSASNELIHAIRAIARGDSYLDPAITHRVMTGYVGRMNDIGAVTETTLSDREEEVLKKVAWGYSNKEIAAQLDISIKTVEAHKANSMKKLNLRGRTDIVRYALFQGWLKES